ncbi:MULTISPECIES: ImmA/IrrE family metallo-endopeptidase [Bacillus]|uniref:ImmA/IrrE family metallo-endopeptidase n=1 Tax=Bacillus TaxID=1386 RepID=UPI0005976208|nr:MULTISPECIES: ImmA/IrrE family metallo-endopeptidase [Bacillus]MED1530535.1 ImmA/IrrE family metallo-endopeptidase [Bacillus altitudinis]UUH74530.1 ImmA/IrrE family metallo-endopeptidase [Bacillus altitudinis]
MYTDKRIKHIAQHVINDHQSNDPQVLSKKLDIIILPSNLGSKINGFLQYHEGANKYLIHLNNNLDYHDQQATLAHELGHFFLHKEFNTFKIKKTSIVLESKLESQANTFAAELLLPDSLLKGSNLCIRNLSAETIATRYNVPLAIAKIKYKQNKKLSIYNRRENFHENHVVII